MKNQIERLEEEIEIIESQIQSLKDLKHNLYEQKEILISKSLLDKCKYVLYKNKVYKLGFIGDTKYGYRARLEFIEVPKEFWVDGLLVQPSSLEEYKRRKNFYRQSSGYRFCEDGKGNYIDYDDFQRDDDISYDDDEYESYHHELSDENLLKKDLVTFYKKNPHVKKMIQYGPFSEKNDSTQREVGPGFDHYDHNQFGYNGFDDYEG